MRRAEGFDLAGAATLATDRARRWAPLLASPAVTACWKLLVRNTWAAPAALVALEAELAKHPERAVPLTVPVFDASGAVAVPVAGGEA